MSVNNIIFRMQTKDGKDYDFTYKNGNFYHPDGKRYDPGKEKIGNGTMYKYLTALRKIENSGDSKLKNQLNTLVESENKHVVTSTDGGSGVSLLPGKLGTNVSEISEKVDKGIGVETLTGFNFSESEQKRFEEIEGVPASVLSTVVHEMSHQYDYETGNMRDETKWENDKRKSGMSISGNRHMSPTEKRAVSNANRVRKSEYKRTTYGGKKIL